jgi:hypothetical protein
MRSKTRVKKTTGAIASAMQAVADAITPKPIRAGNKMIIPSADPSMPPVIVPAAKRARRKSATAARRSTKARKATKATKATRSRKGARTTKRGTKTARRRT